jgi:hypothetical protein
VLNSTHMCLFGCLAYSCIVRPGAHKQDVILLRWVNVSILYSKMRQLCTTWVLSCFQALLTNTSFLLSAFLNCSMANVWTNEHFSIYNYSEVHSKKNPNFLAQKTWIPHFCKCGWGLSKINWDVQKNWIPSFHSLADPYHMTFLPLTSSSSTL